MNRSELLTFLQVHSLAPLKQLSQNFLVDRNILDKICRTAHVEPGEFIVEIGPGPGALTQALLDRGAHLLAIEKDRGFAALLPRLQTPDQRLDVICQDALEASLPTPATPFKVVANLPYHITTPLLAKLCHHSPFLSSAVVMVQKEVAERLTSPEESSLSLFLQFHGHVSREFSVSKECFYPKPSIDSTVIRITFHPPPPVDAKAFFTLVHTAFRQKRKMIRSSLRGLYPPQIVEKALSSLSLRPDERPERLCLDAWLALFHKLQETLIEGR